MMKREQKLRQSPSCQRAISLPLSSRHEINRQVRLRVVREFNLPDTVADLLEVSILLFLFLNIILESLLKINSNKLLSLHSEEFKTGKFLL